MNTTAELKQLKNIFGKTNIKIIFDTAEHYRTVRQHQTFNQTVKELNNILI